MQDARLATPRGDLGGLTIVLVEDSDDLREALRLVLKCMGAEVRAVASLGEALESIRRARPRMLLMDLPTPIVDEFELLKDEHLFEDNGSPRLLGVALTCPDLFDEQVSAIVAGFDVLLDKPVDPVELLRVVHELDVRERVVPEREPGPRMAPARP